MPIPLVVAITFSLCLQPSAWELKVDWVPSVTGENDGGLIFQFFFFAIGLTVAWPDP